MIYVKFMNLLNNIDKKIYLSYDISIVDKSIIDISIDLIQL